MYVTLHGTIGSLVEGITVFTITDKAAVDIDMTFNTEKTALMLFNLYVKYTCKMIVTAFHSFVLMDAICHLFLTSNTSVI